MANHKNITEILIKLFLGLSMLLSGFQGFGSVVRFSRSSETHPENGTYSKSEISEPGQKHGYNLSY